PVGPGVAAGQAAPGGEHGVSRGHDARAGRPRARRAARHSQDAHPLWSSDPASQPGPHGSVPAWTRAGNRRLPLYAEPGGLRSRRARAQPGYDKRSRAAQADASISAGAGGGRPDAERRHDPGVGSVLIHQPQRQDVTSRRWGALSVPASTLRNHPARFATWALALARAASGSLATTAS